MCDITGIQMGATQDEILTSCSPESLRRAVTAIQARICLLREAIQEPETRQNVGISNALREGMNCDRTAVAELMALLRRLEQVSH